MYIVQRRKIPTSLIIALYSGSQDYVGFWMYSFIVPEKFLFIMIMDIQPHPNILQILSHLHLGIRLVILFYGIDQKCLKKAVFYAKK